VVLSDNSVVDICIGEDENDPILYISDVAPHLGQNQAQKTLSSAFEGESLNLLVGSMPYPDKDESDRIKLNVLSMLNEKYGITEADLISAELCAVPADKARDAGLDRSMIASYGHDDRVCAYPALSALFDDTLDTTHTVMAVLADKEETGSNGNTGMKSSILYDLIGEIATKLSASPAVVRANSRCLSADVNVAYDPGFGDVFERRNTAFLNHGVVISKYTGARGKSGTSDASAEFLGSIRNMFEKSDIIWQIAELGKVDQGGGGTVAAYIADLNIDVIDLGVPVLSMHAPCEIIAKLDVYMAHKAILALYNE
jgi:aspartyl aminopeptidase